LPWVTFNSVTENIAFAEYGDPDVWKCKFIADIYLLTISAMAQAITFGVTIKFEFDIAAKTGSLVDHDDGGGGNNSIDGNRLKSRHIFSNCGKPPISDTPQIAMTHLTPKKTDIIH
jgi:hypothetical protein